MFHLFQIISAYAVSIPYKVIYSLSSIANSSKGTKSECIQKLLYVITWIHVWTFHC